VLCCLKKCFFQERSIKNANRKCSYRDIANAVYEIRSNNVHLRQRIVIVGIERRFICKNIGNNGGEKARLFGFIPSKISRYMLI
jgi:hypothetical protein